MEFLFARSNNFKFFTILSLLGIIFHLTCANLIAKLKKKYDTKIKPKSSANPYEKLESYQNQRNSTRQQKLECNKLDEQTIQSTVSLSNSGQNSLT